MINGLLRRLDGVGIVLSLVALLHVDLVVWALIIEAQNRVAGMNLNTVVTGFTVCLTAVALLRPRLLQWRWTWTLYLAISVYSLTSVFPYSSNLYFLWVYFDVFLVALFFAAPNEASKSDLVAQSARLLLTSIFTVAVIQKLITPSFIDGSFYFQSFSSGFFGLQFGPFAERFLGQQDLSQHVLDSGAKVVSQLNPHQTVGSVVDIPIGGSEFLLRTAKPMAWATIIVESTCAALFALNRSRRLEGLNHLALYGFIFGTYVTVPLIVDWGWAFATLGMATASPRWRLGYLALMPILLLVALTLAPESVRLNDLYGDYI